MHVFINDDKVKLFLLKKNGLVNNHHESRSPKKIGVSYQRFSSLLSRFSDAAWGEKKTHCLVHRKADDWMLWPCCVNINQTPPLYSHPHSYSTTPCLIASATVSFGGVRFKPRRNDLSATVGLWKKILTNASCLHSIRFWKLLFI